MAVIGFVAHDQREGAVAVAKETVEWLAGMGHEARLLDANEPHDHPAPGALDLAVSLGGDGTMLRTVDLVSSAGVPVLGVNMGHLGYLTVVEPVGLRDALLRFISGEYQVESRMTLDVSVGESGGDTGPSLLHRSALNDVILQHSVSGHTMRTRVTVDGALFLTYVADSLIVATPTGSTAYNLSARGPIVSPRAEVLVLTPVAPHMLFDRSLVLDAQATVTIEPIGDQAIDVVVDGWPAATLEEGQALQCRRGSTDARLVTFGERNFHRILKSKFNLTDW